MIVMCKDDFLLLNIINKETTLNYAQGIYVDTIDKCFIVTDGKALTKRPYMEIGEEIATNFFVPKPDCKNMKKILKNNYGEIMKEDNIYYFLSGGEKIEMNIGDINNYPNYASLISSTNNNKKILTLSINPSNMMNMLKAIPTSTSELAIDIPMDKSVLVMKYDNSISLMLPTSLTIHELPKPNEDIEND
jgi:hypothetical protein